MCSSDKKSNIFSFFFTSFCCELLSFGIVAVEMSSLLLKLYSPVSTSADSIAVEMEAVSMVTIGS